jgi:hypothetical protein
LLQEYFQRIESARSHQTRFRSAPSQNLPLQGRHIVDEHVLDNVDRLYRRVYPRMKFATQDVVFTLEQQRIIKPPPPR